MGDQKEGGRLKEEWEVWGRVRGAKKMKKTTSCMNKFIRLMRTIEISISYII